jgi:hypothetical protein
MSDSKKLHWRGYSSFYRLENHLGPVLNINESQISLFGLEDDIINIGASKMTSMLRRDYLIANALSQKKIKNVIDIGGDIGGLGVILKRYGIDAVIADPNSECKDQVEASGLEFLNMGVEDFIDKNLLSQYEALCCLNFTQVRWVDEELKNKFFDTINKFGPKVVIISLIGAIPLNFSNYIEDSGFNSHAKSFSRFFAFLRFFSRVGLKMRYLNYLLRLDEYTSMQRMLIRI